MSDTKGNGTARFGDDLESLVDASMLALENVRDTSQLERHSCLTVMQCALLLLLHGCPGTEDASEEAATYLQLAMLDVSRCELQALHPKTLLPWSQYQRMIEAGMYGNDGLQAPIVTAGWLVRLDECEKWFHSKGLGIDLSAVKADLEAFTGSATLSDDQDEVKVPLRERRIAGIVATAESLGFDPMNVAYGGKAQIKTECLKTPKLFTDSTFDKAWQEGVNAGRIKVINAEMYGRR